jgi:hypothetical protein
LLLLIGRQACILHGLPVDTFDYDLWVDPDPSNLDSLLRLAEPLDLVPSVERDRLAAVPFFHLENDTKVDVWKVRVFVLATGERLTFGDAYARRVDVKDDARGLVIPIPSLEDLIVLKRLGGRAKDVEDVKALQALLEQRQSGGA